MIIVSSPEEPLAVPETQPTENLETIDLKDPVLAGVLAWLIPGLGHAYQRRYGKAILLFVCIMGTFFYGLYLGSNSTIGPGRVVYLSFREGDMHLPFLCQIGVGLPTLPAVVQAYRMWDGRPLVFGRFMAPPQLEKNDSNQPTPRELYRRDPRFFELGTVYTMIAGLLNVLAIYDACCGPVPIEEERRKEDDEPNQDKDEAEKGP
jgi:hypothetical protein